MYPHAPNGVECCPREDGIKHLNIYSKAGTDLGTELSFFTHRPFEHPLHGSFQSMEAFYHYIATGSKHETLRFLHGYAAKSAGRNFPKVPMDHTLFQSIICDGLWSQLSQYPMLALKVRDCQLPFAHYYVTPDGRVHLPQKHQWIVELYEYMRTKLINGSQL